MITHSSESRGMANHGWLKSRHTFSFADYYDPKRMGFGALRVINDDSVAGGAGFGMHPHRDMEIISIPLAGSLKHKDSEGNAHVIKKGEVQIMSAGTGIFHSEYNGSESDEVKFLQIWVMPKKYGVKPRYEQKAFDLKPNELTVVVSPDGKDGSVGINQDAYFSMANLEADKSLTYSRHLEGNGLYLFLISGVLEVNGQPIKTRDGLAITDFEKLDVKAMSKCEILFMEVPMMGAKQ